MAPATPKASKTAHFKNASTSSQKKMKQSSLLSFFSKQMPSGTPSKKDCRPTSVTPQNSHTEKVTEKPESKKAGQLFVDIDGDNDLTMAEETLSTAKSETAHSQEPHSDTLLNANVTDVKSAITADDDMSSSSQSPRTHKRRVNYAESDEEASSTTFGTKRKRSKVIDSESDEDEYVPDKNEADEDDDDNDVIESEGDVKHELDDNGDDDDDDLLSLAEATSKRKIPNTSHSSSPFTGSTSHMNSKDKSRPKQIRSRSYTPPRSQKSAVSKSSKFNKQNEERYQWLVDERDAQRRSKNDPEYDPRTLYIPSSAWNKFTPFEKQYWEIKSKMWDCIVFFKKGKFFELYEKDALLANALFDLKIAGGGRANMQLAGIPEMSFEYWAAQFIQMGYKVAKVDQRESMLAKEMREGSKGIVKRELQCILTSGTLTDGDMLHSDLATFCLAIREEPGNYYNQAQLDSSTMAKKLNTKIFGAAFIDTATGEIQMLEFEDDSECTKLDTLMSQVKPMEVVMERNNLSTLANKIVKFNSAPNAIFNEVKAGEEFYDSDKTYSEIISSAYFPTEEDWPDVLKNYHDMGKNVGFSAFGGLLYYLKWLKLDENLISMKNIKEYNFVKSQHSMVLDGITLQNLEIFSNSFDGSDKGTLFKLFNRAITPMGKRMMKKWLMHPLLHKNDIENRLDSIDSLLQDITLREDLESTFSKLPDLERMLARIHSRTIKVRDFEKVITALETIVQLQSSLQNNNLKGDVSQYISSFPEELVEGVENWTNAFERQRAINENVIVPQRGFDVEFDKSLDKIQELEGELMKILVRYRKEFKCSNIQYKDSGKEIYTIEIPVSVTARVPSNWVQMAANKTYKRYYSDEVRTLARSMAEAKELHKTLEEDLKNRLCQKFDAHYNSIWMPTIQAISNIDCLLSITRTSESLGTPSCRPTIVDEVDAKTNAKLNGYLKFESLRHPCFNLGATTAKDFIPNDIELGKEQPRLGLLTGANAAGKSTILRMACIAVIMAQMGCYVPCESAVLTPIDRIMTRLGANDNIMQGKSTFFVELAETKKILDLATNRSLLVVDELGRGGSSSDGFAIAEGVLHHVATHIQSLGFFATHYGTLASSFKHHPQVRPLKMSILVDEATRNVTFLYKMLEGQSEGSFGMHVASMCGISKDIIDNAQIAADNLEHTSRLAKERDLAANNLEGEVVSLSGGLQSDFVRIVYGDGLQNTKLGSGEGVLNYDWNIKGNVLKSLFSIIDNLDS
ncbi:Msh6p [Saccharomyces cerevisiae x Saccharomyces kudriavzevii VIN7]|uniref:DNA mismatch repair protein n=1 Tax=Saccharomyces cerevisiae x Saccharomyces kudriavzevii (strain VIN7) TaxID=1095631 RepID=H0GSP9_SACCK|nr:Msh6p [Saccharomyces cerevisiae x Saccharomyces kudriavzevii VIN7]